MVNEQKRKGTDWERKLVKLINRFVVDADAKRIPGSGAIGTALGESVFTGDVKVDFYGWPNPWKIEAKTGYGGATQLTVKKEWLDKILEEAQQAFATPALAIKFLNARSGVKSAIILDLDTFFNIMNHIAKLYAINQALYKELEELSE